MTWLRAQLNANEDYLRAPNKAVWVAASGACSGASGPLAMSAARPAFTNTIEVTPRARMFW